MEKEIISISPGKDAQGKVFVAFLLFGAQRFDIFQANESLRIKRKLKMEQEGIRK